MVWSRGHASEFGDNVRRLRKDAGLTQEKLAILVGMSKNHIQLVEAGLASSRGDGPISNPRMSTVYVLADALGVPVRDLLPGQPLPR